MSDIDRGLTADDPGEPGATRKRGSLPVTLLGVIASGAQASVTLIIARSIGVSEFGLYTLVVTAGGFFLVASSLNLPLVVVQEIPRRGPSQDPRITTTATVSVLLASTATALAALALNPVIYSVTGMDFATVLACLVYAVAMTLATLVDSVWRGRRRYTRVIGARLGTTTIYAATCAWLITHQVTEFLVYTSALGAMYLLQFVFLLPGLNLRIGQFSSLEMRSQVLLGVHLSVTTVLLLVIFNADIIMLNRMSDSFDLGVYSIYNGFPKKLMAVLLTEGIGIVMLPIFASANTATIMAHLGRLAIVIVIGSAAVCVLGYGGLLWLVGDDYPRDPHLIALATVGFALHTLVYLVYFAASMDSVRGAQIIIRSLGVAAPIALAVQFLFIQRYALVGGLVAFIISNALVLLILAVNARASYGDHRKGVEH